MDNHSLHIPVLTTEVVELLDLVPGELVVDATVGDGGHAQQLLTKVSPGGYLIGIDKDPEAVKAAYENLSHQKSNAKFVINHDSFGNLSGIIKTAGYRGIDAILFDLGLSSRELAGTRGFSFLRDAPLDMRFDPDAPVTAADIVNSYPKDKLANLIYEFGEERASRRIAEAIFSARHRHKITTTEQLAAIVAEAKGGRHGRIHPATQTFQALRIAVNDELGLLRTTLPVAIQLLNPGGRLAVISYHSLEDRIVKNIFRDAAKTGVVQLITKKPISPTRAEILQNPRARSAKLRVISKIG
ncbi:MAG: 16S rRNA (cytosine(1402)-N(4))-methyltransferase RsmH [Patescibacteria group bacterium]